MRNKNKNFLENFVVKHDNKKLSHGNKKTMIIRNRTTQYVVLGNIPKEIVS